MSNRPRRSLQTAGKLLEKAASGLFRWATTDHSGIGKMHKLMPKRGFLEELQHTLVYLIIAIFGAVLQVAWILIVFILADFKINHWRSPLGYFQERYPIIAES